MWNKYIDPLFHTALNNDLICVQTIIPIIKNGDYKLKEAVLKANPFKLLTFVSKGKNCHEERNLFYMYLKRYCNYKESV